MVGMIPLTGLVIIVLGLLFFVWIDFYNKFTCEAKSKKIYRKWVNFYEKKPPCSGWYLCTIEMGSRFPMLLYWEYGPGGYGRFIDPVRKSVFDTYLVVTTEKIDEFTDTEAIMPDDERFKRVYTDDLVDRTKSVIAWKSEPKVFMKPIKNEKAFGMNRVI